MATDSHNKEFEKLQKAIDTIMMMPGGAGITVLKKFYELSGYGASLMTYNQQTSDMNTQATIYNLSKRDVWLLFRKHLTPDQRTILED